MRYAAQALMSTQQADPGESEADVDGNVADALEQPLSVLSAHDQLIGLRQHGINAIRPSRARSERSSRVVSRVKQRE